MQGFPAGIINGDSTITIINALMIDQYSVGLNPAGFISTNGDTTCDDRDAYLKVGFTSGAGRLTPGQDSGEIQLSITNSSASDYGQDNDYSFDRAMTNNGDNVRVTACIDGELVYGREP